MNLSALLSYVAALSIATERVTELIKRFPGLSNFLSHHTKGEANSTQENLRVMAVTILAILVGTVLCHYFPASLAQINPGGENNATWPACFGYGLLACGGSNFWNSALDTFRGVKQKMGG